jgi:hypothetical protein
MRVIALCRRLPSLHQFFALVASGHALSRQNGLNGLLLSALVSRPINAPVPKCGAEMIRPGFSCSRFLLVSLGDLISLRPPDSPIIPELVR